MLEHDHQALHAAAAALAPKLDAIGVDLTGDAEIKVEWDTGDGVLCRGVPDCVTDATVYDLKVGEYVTPSDVGRKIYSMGYDIQGAAYVEAVEELSPSDVGRVQFVLVFVQPEPPYGVTVAHLDGLFRDLGAVRWQRAKTLWKACQQSGRWDDYSGEVVRAEPPRWALYQEGLA